MAEASEAVEKIRAHLLRPPPAVSEHASQSQSHDAPCPVGHVVVQLEPALTPDRLGTGGVQGAASPQSRTTTRRAAAAAQTPTRSTRASQRLRTRASASASAEEEEEEEEEQAHSVLDGGSKEASENRGKPGLRSSRKNGKEESGLEGKGRWDGGALRHRPKTTR